MRRPLRMILAVLFAALGVPSSHADSFTPIFTCFTACAATPTAPDVSFPAPLVMDVTWENMVFDFSLPSSSQPTGISGWELVTPAAFSQSGSASFTISPGGTFITVVVPFLFQLDDNNNCLNCHIIEDGTLQFAPAEASSVPEPSSIVLMLAGIGFLLMVMRKRFAHVHHHVPDFPRLLPILFLTLASAAKSSAATITFFNTGAITIPASGTASSDIAVSGFSGGITNLMVELKGLNTTTPDDIEISVVGPAGEKLILMSDAGGDHDVVATTLLFSDAALDQLPALNPPNLVSGTFKPTDYGVDEGLSSPAPAGTSTLFTVFNGTDPNGSWSLDIVANAGTDVASLSGGWALILTADASGSVTEPPPAATPEPTPLILLGTGILGLATAARRKLPTLRSVKAPQWKP